MAKWCENLAVSMESHGERVCKLGSLLGVPCRARVEKLPRNPMESAVWILDILVEYHEKSELW